MKKGVGNTALFFAVLVCMSSQSFMRRTPSAYELNTLSQLEDRLAPTRGNRISELQISPLQINPAVLADYYVKQMGVVDTKLKDLVQKNLRRRKKENMAQYAELVQGPIAYMQTPQYQERSQLHVRTPSSLGPTTLLSVTPESNQAEIPALNQMGQVFENPGALFNLPLPNVSPTQRPDLAFMQQVTSGIAQEAGRLQSQLTARQRIMLGAVFANVIQFVVWPILFKK